jgi:sortase A
VKERGVSFAQMIENASWILPTAEERLTLVTCWPPYESTYRLIVVARPEPPEEEDPMVSR